MMRKYELYNGDCAEIMKQLPDEFIDLTVTSPPYDDLRIYKGYVFDFEAVAKELLRITKPGGVIVWVVGDSTVKGSETGTSFKQALYFKEIGFNIHDTMIYHKDNPPPTGGNNRYYQAFEYMFVISKGKPSTFNPIISERRNKWNDKRTERFRAITRDKNGEFSKKIVQTKDKVKTQNVWKYVVSGGSTTADKIAYRHPAIFPEKLAEDHILSWSQLDNFVLDPFCGSGTTGKMALLNKRRFIGIEISHEYMEISRKRIEMAIEQEKLFEGRSD